MRKSALMGCMSHRAAKEITQLRAHISPIPTTADHHHPRRPHLLLPVPPAQHPPQDLGIRQ